MSQPSFLAADGTRLVVGRGAVTFDRFNASGKKVGAKPLGNVEAMEISASVETVEKRGFVDNTNPLLARVETSRTLEVNLTLSEYKRFNLALALFGTEAAYAQAAAPVSGEVLVDTVGGQTGSVQGSIYYTAIPHIGSVTLKDDAVAVTNSPANYILDAATGAIYIAPGGTIVDGSKLTVDYTPVAIVAADGYDLITPGAAGTIIGEMVFTADNLNGKIAEVKLWRVQISPEGAVGFITEEFANFPLKGTLLSDAVLHPNTPFGQIIQRP